MKPFPIANIAHAAHVTRWHSVPAYERPSIAEHSWLVCVYALYLAKGILVDFTAEEERMLTRLALWHDVAETITGDLPTPVKRYIESLFPQGQSPLDSLEEQLCEPYAEAKAEAPGYIKIIVKLADVMDATNFAVNEIKGPARLKISKERKASFAAYIQKGEREYPQYQWSYAHDLLKELLTSEPIGIDFTELVDHSHVGAMPLNDSRRGCQTERKECPHASLTTRSLIVELLSRLVGRRPAA